ncbi:MAG: D-alanyl-D-alanine carboxypeptidase family protein [Candidatus Kerfeldbacteria bacterium]|nr:D-alanyl-D-alanine carboxypeptidase family protein [Candidatus Kerfeldbacteria bacterium]
MFGGMQWVTAAGNEQKITSAKEIITSALAGLIIALLSYTILLLINPATVNIGVDVFKIPVQYQCPYTVEVIPIPTVQGLSGNGAQACPNVAAGLVEVAQNMVANICASCTIQVGSAYRSPEQQAPLYECYQKCVDEGYIDSAGTTRKKEGFPSGCHSCNKAAKPCCSNHQKGVAVDLWYDYGGGDPLIAPTSKGKLSQSYNNGGGDEALANNQFELQQVMTATGKFSPISVEWWHFDLKSKQCGLAATNCQVVGTAGSTIANNAYCYTTRPSDNLILYKAARCNGNVPACDPSSGLTWYTASTGSDCDFTSFVDSTPDPRSVNVYTTKPSCVYNDRGRVD